MSFTHFFSKFLDETVSNPCKDVSFTRCISLEAVTPTSQVEGMLSAEGISKEAVDVQGKPTTKSMCVYISLSINIYSHIYIIGQHILCSTHLFLNNSCFTDSVLNIHCVP